MRWWRDLRLPAEDDTSRQVDLCCEIIAIERQSSRAIWAALLVGGLAAWQYEDSLNPGHIIAVALIVGVLLAIHDQLVAMRADAIRRELRDLPPRF